MSGFELFQIIADIIFALALTVAITLVVINRQKLQKQQQDLSCMRLSIGEIDCLWNPHYDLDFANWQDKIRRIFTKPVFHVYHSNIKGGYWTLCSLWLPKSFSKGEVNYPRSLGHRLCPLCEERIDTISDLRELDRT